MLKRIIILGVFLFFSQRVFADIIINEFLSHPSSGGKEWVELKNTGSSPVDLSGWKLTELSSPDINPVEKDMISLSGNIDDFIVFDISSSKLNDNGDSIGLYNGENIIDRVTYGTESKVKNYSINLSVPQVDESGSLISGIWKVTQNPTKNLPNSSSDSGEDSSENLDGTSNDSDEDEEEDIPEVYRITTKILVNKVLIAGIAFPVNSLTTDNKKQTMLVGRYVWNFGDGTRREEAKANSSEYLYQYPGEYILTLDYFSYYSPFVLEPEAKDRIVIKVVPSELNISSIGTFNDPFVELENKSKYEINLSNWVLKSLNKSFIIPEGTNILSGKKIKLSSRITGFDGIDIQNLSLVYPSGEIISNYPSVKKNNNYISNISGEKYSNYSNKKVEETILKENSDTTNLNNLEANAQKSFKNLSIKKLSYLGLFFVVFTGILIVFYINKPNSYKKELEDYLRPEDITIIE